MEATEPPPLIYHCTDDAGLRGILETGKFWLSDIFNLNDPSELKHGYSLATSILKKRLQVVPEPSQNLSSSLNVSARRAEI
jgi:hypothetical protein